MKLSYEEYKRLNESIATMFTRHVNAANKGGHRITECNVSYLTFAAERNAGFQNRQVDVSSCRGFLGFMMMVAKYPEKFKKDIKFWVWVMKSKTDMHELVLKTMQPERRAKSLVSPNHVMAKKFLENPNSIGL